METPTKIDDKVKIDPHKYEVEMFREQKFNPDLIKDIENGIIK